MAADLNALRNVLAVPAVVVYVLVGYVVGRRDVSLEARPANRAFQTWWYGLAGLTVFTPLTYALQQANVTEFGVYLFMLEFLLVALVVAIGCLVYYLLYVYAGKSWVFWPVAVYHLLVLTWLMYIITQAHPISYNPAACSGGYCYEHDFSTTPASRWLSLSLVVPILLATFAYFGLFFRVTEPVQKYRIALVAGALVFWFGSSLASNFIQGDFETASGAVRHGALSTWVYWSTLSNIISLCASLAILMAYRPPAFIARALERRPEGGTGG